jgi:glutathione synthase/RimK-type ligase-like ATP-grasp enzyme
MPPPVLLIVTAKSDTHADYVIRACEQRGTLLPVRLNSDDFLENACYSFRWDAAGALTRSQLALQDSGRAIETVAVAWWRKPDQMTPPAALCHPEAVRFAQEEGEMLLRCSDALFDDIAWVNHPQAIAASGRKLRQIRVAQSLGLRVPETIVSNQPQELLAFLRAHDRCIIKAIEFGGFRHEGRPWGTYTSAITVEQAQGMLASMPLAPVMLQRAISKQRELRVTVIGAQVFACAIAAQESAHAAVQADWRVANPKDLPHSLVALPGWLEEALVAMLRHYGLHFGAFDLIQEPDGSYAFLELNPNGQYLWIELLTGAPLTAALVTLMEQLAERGAAASP